MSDSNGSINRGTRVLVGFNEGGDSFEATFVKISGTGYRVVRKDDGTTLVLDSLDTMLYLPPTPDFLTSETDKYSLNELKNDKDAILASFDRAKQEKVMRSLYAGLGGFDVMIEGGDYLAALDDDLRLKLFHSWPLLKVKQLVRAFDPNDSGWIYHRGKDENNDLKERYPDVLRDALVTVADW